MVAVTWVTAFQNSTIVTGVPLPLQSAVVATVLGGSVVSGTLAAPAEFSVPQAAVAVAFACLRDVALHSPGNHKKIQNM